MELLNRDATAIHELSHASGAAHRLGRDLSGTFGSESYAFEELIAEMTSCFMAAELPSHQSENHIRNHQAYVGSWIRSIKEKPDSLREAIKEANKAADYLSLMGGLMDERQYQKESERMVEAPASEEPKRKKERDLTKEKGKGKRPRYYQSRSER